jgi:hypothetical protein
MQPADQVPHRSTADLLVANGAHLCVIDGLAP